MVLVVKDRVKDTSTTSGTGTITLDNSPPAGYQAFSTLGNGSTTYYAIQDANDAFEIGLGTYNANTLTRTTVLSSSNSGNLVNLTSGPNTVWVDYPAAKAYLSEEGIDKSFTATASITAGKPVILNSAGTVTQVAETSSTASTISSSNGNEIASVQNYTRDISVAYDTTNDKIGVLYANSNHYPTIAIGSELNNAITWGTPVVVNSASSSPTDHSGQKLAYGNGIFVASYFLDSNDTNYIKAGSYSGTNSITLGSAIQPNTGTSHYTGGTIAYNPNANKFVYTFAENSTTSIIAYLITNSGTTLTTGNSATITMGYTGNNKVIWNGYDPDTNKQVIMTDHLYGDEGRIYQATISGANITVPSTHYAITDEGTNEDGSKALSYDPDNDKWILFKANTGNVLRANVLTASGDTFTSGTATQISSQYMRWLAPYYDTEKNKTVLVSNKNTSPYNGLIGFVTISGTTPSYTASSTTVGNQTAERLYTHTSLYNPDTKSGIVIGATPLSNSKAVGYVLYYETLTSSNLTTSNYLGVASTSASANETVNINIPGSINNDQVGLTVGQDYYAKGDGTIIERTTTTTTPNTTPTATIESLTTVNPSASAKIDIIYDTHNDKVWAYSKDGNNSNYPTVVVGDISSGTSITWGTPVTVTSNNYSPSSKMSNRNLASDGAGNILVAYRDQSNDYARVKVGNYSGTNSATFGNELQPDNVSSLNGFDVGYCSSANLWYMFYGNTSSTKWVLIKQNSGNQNFNSWDTGTVYSGNANIINNVYNSTNNKIILGLNQNTNGRFYVCNTSANGSTNTGYTLNIGTEQSITITGNAESYGRAKLILDTTNNNYIFIDSLKPNPSGMDCSVITESSGSLTQSTPQNVSTGTMSDNTAFYNPNDQKFYGAYQIYSSPYACKNYLLTVSGTTFTFVDGNDMPNADDRGIWTQGIYIADITKGVFVGQTNNGYDLLTAIMSIGSTTSSVVNGSQFVGKAISSTQLLLGEEKGNSMAGLSNGAITKGKPVLMQADGDVAQVKETTSSVTFAQGTKVEIESGWLDQRVISYDVDENKFLVAYRDQDQSNHGFCKVLSVSGTTVSYGSESSAFNSNTTNVIDSVYDPESGNHVIFYTNSSQYGYAVVASISGTSVTFGTPVAFNSANTNYRGTCFYDSTNKKVVWVGGHFSGSYLLKAVVGTVSGTSISFGSLQDSGVSNTDYYSSAYDTNSSVGVYAYHNSGSDGYMGTLSISGTSITWNTPVNFYGTTNVTQSFDSMTYDSVNKKIVHTFRDSQNGKLMAIVATVNGTSLSLGTVVEAVSYANGGNTIYHSVVGTLQGVVPLVYRDANNGYLKYLQGTVSGTSISFAGGVTLDSTNIENTPAIAYDSNNYGIVTSYSDQSTHDLWAVAVTPSGNVVSPNLTATNYLGIASNTVADNEECIINTQGAVNPNQSSLTPGQLYYVQTDGTLSTTAGSPSVIAGIATSATTLLVTKS